MTWVSDQPSLFSDPCSRAGALPTSQRAAQRAKMFASSVAARMLLVYATSESGLTPDQVAGVMGRDVLSVRPRASQALRAGYLIPTGEELPTRHGGTAMVLRITELGLRVVRNLGLLR